jgi:hypothetical protein
MFAVIGMIVISSCEGPQGLLALMDWTDKMDYLVKFFELRM